MAIHQLGLFDIQEGKRRRDAGRDRAASAHGEWLEGVRDTAASIAAFEGTVTSDRLRQAGIDTPRNASRNIWGSVFADPRFTSIGYTKSKRPEAHARPIQIWALSAGSPATGSSSELGHLKKEERSL
jgi:hypothetical protein